MSVSQCSDLAGPALGKPPLQCLCAPAGSWLSLPKVLSQSKLPSSMRAASKAGNGHWSWSRRPGGSRPACFAGPAPTLPASVRRAAIYQGRWVASPACTVSPLSAGWGCVPHMDLESVSLLLMSTSKSLNFAFMCLYSLYSSAIGVRSSFWTLLMETKGKGAEDCLDDTTHQVNYHHVETLQFINL